MRMIGVKSKGRTGDESDIVEFRLSEVNYISVRDATRNNLQLPIYHTQNNELFPLRTIKDIARAYQQYGFTGADRSTVVNTKRIKMMVKDRKDSFVEFIDGTRIDISNRR